eukprot:scaffold14858_cov138-Skeletonema_dohrnii-CCMP3373.AAC.1
MANYHQLLEAVDGHIHSVRYDMALNRGAGGHLRFFISVRYDMALNRGAAGHLKFFIRSPTTL